MGPLGRSLWPDVSATTNEGSDPVPDPQSAKAGQRYVSEQPDQPPALVPA